MAADFVDSEADAIVGDDSVENKILNIVRYNPDGVPTSVMKDALEITKNTALKVLRSLEAEREIYSAKIGKTLVWYPNGRLIHPYLETFMELCGKPYRFSIQEGRRGPMVQIQERSYSLLRGERVEGAIFVELGNLEEFIEGLSEIRDRFRNLEETGVKR